MILAILQHTPTWVYVLFAGLVYLGVKRSRSSEMPVWRLFLLPVAMTAFSLFGLVQAFGLGIVPTVAWTAMFAAALVAGSVLPTRHVAQSASAPAPGTVRVPGSWVPLALMMTIFFLRYAVAVALAMNPSLHVDTAFVAGVAALYGLTSGCFAARASFVWRTSSHAAVARDLAAVA